jgi:uncharacterized protein (TIGR00375 family)
MTLEMLAFWAQLKGINVMGTADFTHPQWFADLREKLLPDETGLYRLRGKSSEHVPLSCREDVCFIPTAEISCIYSKAGKTRKVHMIVILPSLEDASLLNTRLGRIGNLTSDGRPILGIEAKELLTIVLDLTGNGLVIPAHAWTPHFSVFGSASGFDSLEECFDELSPRIHAIETGLSSDPPMNWRLSALDDLTLISNSDAHSPSKIGREANIFDTDLSYEGIVDAIKNKEGFKGTIEFFPEEGKYHYDGHRLCNIWMSPEETRRHDYLCPVCGKNLTVGVMHRVALLADRDNGSQPSHAKDYHSLIPLQEIISEGFRVGVGTKKVQSLYLKMLSELGPELNILMNAEIRDISTVAGELIGEGIRRIREGRVTINPGYDGEYGKILLFEPQERSKLRGQEKLFT